MGLARGLGCFCYVEWGLIHVAACGLFVTGSMANDGSGLGEMYTMVMGGASEALKEGFLKTKWPTMANRILLQHGMNLGWLGGWSFMVAYLAFSQKPLSRYIWLLTVPILVADFAYLVAVDTHKLGEPPGEAQTFICSIGSALLVYDLYAQGEIDGAECAKCCCASLLLAAAGLANVVYHAKGGEL